MKTGNLPDPWMTYVNVGEVEDGWQRVRFGGLIIHQVITY